MARRMKRRPLVAPVPSWMARRDGRGQWVVVNEAGEHPLLSPDPLIRLEGVWLASKAPELRHALKQLTERADRFFRAHSYQHLKDNLLIFAAMGVLRDSEPPWEEVMRLATEGERGRAVQFELEYSAHDHQEAA